MKQRLALTLIFLLSAFFAVQAQVTIGSGELPHNDALLDLKENSAGSAARGLLLPRVTLSATTLASPMSAHVAGMSVYNTSTAGDVTPGYYYNDGTKWVKLSAEANSITPEWFYMPSFALPVTATGTQTFNLYDEYKKQFTKSGNAQFVSSSGIAATVQTVYEKEKLDYFVTAYPTDVLTVNSINASGLMTYEVLTTDVPEGSFINVIFVVK